MSSAHAASKLERGSTGELVAADTKRSTAVADRLRATEDALKSAQSMIAEQEKREKDLKRLLVTNGNRSLDREPAAGPVPTRKIESSSSDQLQAMKTVHDSKTRALMKSIHQLQKQLQALKSQDKEHRRSALIQNLRTSQREQELVIDVLKQSLVEKAPEFQESRELVNDFILKKSIGGPLRFRPSPREELENDLATLDGKYKRAVENLKKARGESFAKVEHPPLSTRNRRQQSDEEDESAIEAKARRPRELAPPVEREVFVADPAQQDEINRLRVELSSASLTIHAQADELHELYAEIECLRLVDGKLERKKDKVEALEEKVSGLQLENVRLVHEMQAEVEKTTQLRDEIQFLHDTRVSDVHTSDSERLGQLELIQSLREREIELQSQLEDQQKKWSIDRTTINQQIRLREKEKDLALEQQQRYEVDLSALQKKHECEGLKRQLSDALQQKESLHIQIEELESTVALHESLSREEQEAQRKTMTTRLREIEEALAEKEELAKKLDRQLTASKLLARQSKKENVQLQDRCAKLQEELAATK